MTDDLEGKAPVPRHPRRVFRRTGKAGAVHRVGILGGGQLGRMMALAAHPLGLRPRVFDPATDAPASACAEHVAAAWDDAAAIDAFCEGLDVATFEFENVPTSVAAAVAARVPLRPSVRSLAVSRDRLAEKELARALNIATAPFARVDDAAMLEAALARTGLPAVLKRRRGGYDGRGQAVVHTLAEARRALASLAGPCIAEGFVRFRRELSLVAVRGLDAEVALYPLAANEHEGGILRRSVAPAPHVPAAVAAQAESAARAMLGALDHVGVLTIEFFEHEGRLLLNEIAPRVHNSGHWTIEGAATSQFENHLRAIAGLPLGSTGAIGCSLLCNVVGNLPDVAALLRLPDTHVHLYGKTPREGRKLGHVTSRLATSAATAEVESRLAELAAALESPRDAATVGGVEDSSLSTAVADPSVVAREEARP